MLVMYKKMTNGRGRSGRAGKKNGGMLKNRLSRVLLPKYIILDRFCTTLIFLLLAMDPAILSSCTEEAIEPVRLKVKSAASVSAAKLDIFVFDDDSLGRLDTYMKADLGGEICLSSRRGSKIICAAHYPGHDWSNIDSYEGFCGTMALLSCDNPSSPILCGESKVKAGSGNICHIDLEPLLSEVVLRKLKCDFSGKAYEGKMLKKGRAYLTNVNAQCPIGRRETYNTGILLNAGAYCKQDDEEAGGILSGEFRCSIGSFNANTYVYTYCYPNDNISDEPGNPPTRLVIEGEIDGKMCYYPINICNFSGSGCGVERNCSYAFDIILKSLGTDDPDTPVSHADVEISFGNAKNWNITDERIETY